MGVKNVQQWVQKFTHMHIDTIKKNGGTGNDAEEEVFRGAGVQRRVSC